MTDEPKILRVSVTELQDFMRCHRAWDLRSPNRQSLVLRGVPRTELHIGSAMHYGWEYQALGYDPMEALDRWFDEEIVKLGTEYATTVGAPMGTEERNRLDESREFCKELMQSYVDKWGPNPIAPLTYLAPEFAFMIPLPLITKEYDAVYLVGTIDGVATDPDGELVTVEHKTYSQKPTDLSLDHQMHGYGWALAQLVGTPPAYSLYDGANKRLPKDPKPLQSGRLSVAKDQGMTTPEKYLEAMKQHRQPMDDTYAAHLDWLKRANEGEQTPFHYRQQVSLHEHALKQWGEDMIDIVAEMASEPALYPHFRWEGCWDCDFAQTLCPAIQRGEDLQFMVEQYYHVGTYGTQKSVRTVTPSEVSSVADLTELVREWRVE